MTLMLVINIRQNIPSMHYKAKLTLLGHSSSPFSASVSQFFSPAKATPYQKYCPTASDEVCNFIKFLAVFTLD